jgi:hypothetical protein
MPFTITGFGERIALRLAIYRVLFGLDCLVPSLYSIGTELIENAFSKNSFIVACLFFASETCLSRRCLATAVYFDFTIPPFSFHVTILTNL